MSDRHSRKSRQKPRDISDALGPYISDEHVAQGLEVLKGQGNPTCATCWHFQSSGESDGICFGVPPAALMRMDGQVTGAFPPVKLSWRCPNWRKAK